MGKDKQACVLNVKLRLHPAATSASAASPQGTGAARTQSAAATAEVGLQRAQLTPDKHAQSAESTTLQTHAATYKAGAEGGSSMGQDAAHVGAASACKSGANTLHSLPAAAVTDDDAVDMPVHVIAYDDVEEDACSVTPSSIASESLPHGSCTDQRLNRFERVFRDASPQPDLAAGVAYTHTYTHTHTHTHTHICIPAPFSARSAP